MLLLAAVLTGGLLSGCWDRVEVNDLALVNGAAFDAAPDGGIRVTLQVILPQHLPSPGGLRAGRGGGAGQPVVAVVSGSGRSIADTTSRLEEQIPGRIFWGHVPVAVVGQDLAQRDIAEVVDFFVRDRTARISTDVLIARGRAGPLMQVSPPYRSLPADNIHELLRLGLMPRAPVYLFAKALRKPGRGFFAPALTVVEPRPSGGDGGGGGGAAAAVPQDFATPGAAVFAGRRLVGWLTPEQARGALWLTGDIRRGTVTLEDQGSTLTLELERTVVQRRAIRQGQGVAILIEIDTRDALVSVRDGQIDVSRPGTLDEVNALLQERIRQRAEEALHAVQAMNADAFDFGSLVAAYQPMVWSDTYTRWARVFPSVPVIIRVRTHIRSTGNLINAPRQ